MPFYLVPSKNIHKRGHSDAHAQQRAAHKYAVLQDSVIHTQRTQRHPHTSHFGVPTPSIISLSNIPKHFPTHAVLQDSVIHTQRTQRHPHTSHFGVPTPSIISLSNIPKHFPTHAVLQDSVIHTQRTQRHPHTSHFGVPTPSIISLSNIPKHFPTHVNTRIHITYIYIYVYVYMHIYICIYLAWLLFFQVLFGPWKRSTVRRSFAWFRLKEAVLICESVEEPVNFWSRFKCSDVQGNPRSGVVKAAAEMQTAKHFPSLLRGSKACLAATWQHSSLVLQNDLLRKDGIMYQHNGSRKFLREWVRNTTSILQHKYSIIQNILILIFAIINIIE